MNAKAAALSVDTKRPILMNMAERPRFGCSLKQLSCFTEVNVMGATLENTFFLSSYLVIFPVFRRLIFWNVFSEEKTGGSFDVYAVPSLVAVKNTRPEIIQTHWYTASSNTQYALSVP
jgi:hypothetical protein